MKLIKFNNHWKLVFLFIVCGLFLFCTFLLTYKIEVYDNAILKVSSDDSSKLIINSGIAYKINDLPTIILKYNNQYHKIDVLEISPMEEKDMFEMKVTNSDQWLIENTTINVTIIYEKKLILDYIF